MAKRFNGIKTIFDNDNYKDVLQFCESVLEPYTVTESNYTLKVQSDFCNYYFLQNMRTPFAFAVGKMIMKNIKATGLEAPDVEKNDLKYFDFNIPSKLKKGFHTGEIFTIDLKHAYAYVLHNHGLITDKTFGYMETLAKPDRLAAIGMLASQKEIFEIIGKEVINSYSEINDMKNWFYFAVTRTNEIMYKCREILGNTFLHFWVDGIFADSEIHIQKVCDYLDSIGYKYSYEECHDYTFFQDDKGERIEYYKMDSPKKKTLFLPKKNNEAAKFLINFLSLHDTSNN